MTDSSSSPSPLPRFWALIPCAGTGSRAGADGPKQYRPLAGQPLVMHTLAAFAAVPRLHRTLVVLAPGDDFLDGLELPFLVAKCGGATRAQSVLNGLRALVAQGAQEADWVLVHDAARCLITPAQIMGLMDALAQGEVGGLLAHKLPDTLKREVNGRVAARLDRSDKWLAQTPQMFPLGLLRRALLQAGDHVTDESSAVEALGLAPRLVAGSAQNFKVTYPEDFALAEAVLRGREASGVTDRSKG
ncbi:MAG: 2-C-methyl-D-erythritol 4-phosphate cytidylyltransferase [Burkholderiales bacterium]|nr:2-C-methyl-D-erythritol 4-phosphate cytidylyltransferase [Burkholderiales bacterium]